MPYESIFKPDLFAGRSVVVTGAGTGIGRATAHELAALGAHVALVGRRLEKLEAVAAEIAADGGRTTLHVCDIREDDHVTAAVAEIMAAHGRIDGLVNNAGGQFRSPLRDMKTKGWEAVVRSNLTGGFIFSREVYRAWMEANSGSIVNIIADVQGGWAYCAHSGAARAGMENFTQTAAFEWAASGTRVNCVAPGLIYSSGIDTYPEEEQRKYMKWAEAVPMRRFGTVSEISAAITFLLSPAAAYITGSTLKVDGGAPTARVQHPIPNDRPTPAFNGFHLSSDAVYK